ncbi:zinc ribbon domain-containing protein [Leptospira ilyithenensis]|uniref:Zinc ribbon domain-containing protein n=1 Tax=Leptospira ilyithenensis TaxID=2484901 RepID=A0A4R9LQK6_9LEPT|nr:zinc ribbon domain-containing protein [Leptospira ilyithenensis]TGN10517.1 zinc ribbon domain-containing protein [Leptospira ilyithenensis]
MDFLLYFYILLFGIILLSPFLIFYYYFQIDSSPFGKDSEEDLLPFVQKKQNLLDSLKDVRSDFHSRKLTEEEFQSLSVPFLQKLDEVELEIKNFKETKNLTGQTIQTLEPQKTVEGWTCRNCGTAISIPNANFCPSCGSGKLA